MLMPQNIDQGEPPATQFFLLEDSASSEPSAEALFLSTESIVQGEPFATEAHFPLLEDIEPSELFATEQHFPRLEDIEPSELFATEAHFPLLEDSAPSEPFATEAHFPERKYKTWTPGPWTPSVDAVHGPGPPKYGPGPWTPCFY